VPRRPLFRSRSRARRAGAAAVVVILGGVVAATAAALGSGGQPQPALARPAAPTASSASSGASSLSSSLGAPTAAPTTTLPPLPTVLDAALVNTDACLVVRDAQGRTLYSHQPSVPLAPASTQKLLVAAAALDVLGPDYRFTTTVVTDRPLVHGVADQVWLVGGGDPVLASPDFTTFLGNQPEFAHQPVTTPLAWLADQLHAAGVVAVFGGVRGDDRRYDRARFLPAWKPSYIKDAEAAPLGALEVDDGLDRWRPVPTLTADPAAHAAGVLARLLTERGVAATQGPDGTAPANAIVLAHVVSPPLSDLVTSMLRVSDNTAAELLVRELDRATGGTGTTAGGLAVVQREAAKLGVPVDGVHLDDGSGLAPSDRATCDALLAALDLGTQPRFAALSLLSVSGRYGTLINRFLGTPAQGQLAGKTGSIDGVAGLVARWGNVEFAFLLNGKFTYAAGAAYEDRIVAALAPYAPAPAPAAATPPRCGAKIAPHGKKFALLGRKPRKIDHVARISRHVWSEAATSGPGVRALPGAGPEHLREVGLDVRRHAPAAVHLRGAEADAGPGAVLQLTDLQKVLVAPGVGALECRPRRVGVGDENVGRLARRRRVGRRGRRDLLRFGDRRRPGPAGRDRRGRRLGRRGRRRGRRCRRRRRRGRGGRARGRRRGR